MSVLEDRKVIIIHGAAAVSVVGVAAFIAMHTLIIFKLNLFPDSVSKPVISGLNLALANAFQTHYSIKL